jgi:hypothetical protein
VTVIENANGTQKTRSIVKRSRQQIEHMQQTTARTTLKQLPSIISDGMNLILNTEHGGVLLALRGKGGT